LDFDEVGGTILVYEIDARKGQDTPELAADVAQVLQRRLDPDDRGNATVRPWHGRVEIRIPRRREGHAEAVASIKDMVSRVGRLEFQILANNTDDRAAIEDIKKMINLDRAVEFDLIDTREKGLPPPTLGEGKEPKKYQIITAGGSRSVVTYSWVELGPQERRALNLDNAARTDPARNQAWHKAAEARNRATELPDMDRKDIALLQGALFFSRPCEDRKPA
jgi:SecD/SecF fusion protein